MEPGGVGRDGAQSALRGSISDLSLASADFNLLRPRLDAASVLLVLCAGLLVPLAPFSQFYKSLVQRRFFSMASLCVVPGT